MDEKPETAVRKPQPRRRWYQYGLRTLLIFVTLAGCGFGWLGAKVREARQQEAVVALIGKTGGFVVYDYEIDSQGNRVRKAALPGPAWLHALLGDDCFRNVREISFEITNGSVGDERITVTDDELEQFGQLKGLEVLDLGYTRVTQVGLRHLKGLTQLKTLSLNGTQVTDAELEYVSCMSQLTLLALSSTKVTNAGMEHLKGLTRLEWLNLDCTQVTDAGLEHLKGLTQLAQLLLDGTKVTDSGVAKLQKALPNCQISH